MFRYQPTSSLRSQLYAIRSGQTNITSPRKNSTPCMDPKLSGRSFNESVLSPRLSQRHAFVSPPAAYSTPSRVGGTSPTVWVPNNHQQKNITPINLVARNNIQFDAADSPASSLTPSDSISMSPSHGPHELNGLSRMNCQNSTSSNSLESQNFVQMDRQVFFPRISL